MKRRRRNLEASAPEVSRAWLPLSRNNEKMIFPSHDELSGRIFPPLDERSDAISRGASHGAAALSPRSLIVSGVI